MKRGFRLAGVLRARQAQEDAARGEVLRARQGAAQAAEDVATRAGLNAASFPRHEVALRNRATPVVVRVVARAAGLAM